MKELSNKEKLVHDVKEVIAGAETLLSETAGNLTGKAKDIQHRLSEKIQDAKSGMKDLEGLVKEKAIAGAKETDHMIREHPYESIGIAFGVGLLIGILINRK
jgi:ElaB/YqjD/DUF883 family membrane-anchored ribosome-binding protein